MKKKNVDVLTLTHMNIVMLFKFNLYYREIKKIFINKSQFKKNIIDFQLLSYFYYIWKMVNSFEPLIYFA